ncbi:MAG: thermonuclease family protein [Blastocatellia bacterium]
MLSFKQQQYQADIPPRWSIGVDKRHVAVYVAVALVAGFSIGFIVARSIVHKEAGPQLPASPALAQPRQQAQPETLSNEFRLVKRILRADTIEVDGVGAVRMIGVETPDGRTPQGIYAAHGQNALNFIEKSLLNQEVRLEFDPANAVSNNKDESGQTLAYVYTRDGTFINTELVKQGLGFVRTSDEFKFSDNFRAQEREAMQSMRGVWGSSSGATSTTAAAQQPPPATMPGPTDEKTRRLSPLPPSAIGPNVPAISGASSSAASTSSSEPSVFISSTDRVYHKSGCELLGKKKQAIGLSEARSKGYTACSRCYASTVLKAP